MCLAGVIFGRMEKRVEKIGRRGVWLGEKREEKIVELSYFLSEPTKNWSLQIEEKIQERMWGSCWTKLPLILPQQLTIFFIVFYLLCLYLLYIYIFAFLCFIRFFYSLSFLFFIILFIELCWCWCWCWCWHWFICVCVSCFGSRLVLFFRRCLYTIFIYL